MPKTSKQMREEATEAGRKARLHGLARTSCPEFADYPVQGRTEAWLKGWDSVGSENPYNWPATDPNNPTPYIKVQAVTITTPAVTVTATRTEAVFLPKDAPMPQDYERDVPPCQFCRCKWMAGGIQAVIVKVTNPHEGMAYMTCRNCGQDFKRRIRQPGAPGRPLYKSEIQAAAKTEGSKP